MTIWPVLAWIQELSSDAAHTQSKSDIFHTTVRKYMLIAVWCDKMHSFFMHQPTNEETSEIIFMSEGLGNYKGWIDNIMVFPGRHETQPG
jgi:hypothetical protein